MKLIDKAYVEANKSEIIEAIRSGKIFIYPTDTIYGIGCNALLADVVNRIREIKHRDERPFSIIAPSKQWIVESCEVEADLLDQYLPGPYTLIVGRKGGVVAKEVNPIDDTLGVRIPDHWFTNLVEEVGIPFVTTSVNISGEPHMEKFEDLKTEIKDQVDYVVYEGEKRGQRSERITLV